MPDEATVVDPAPVTPTQATPAPVTPPVAPAAPAFNSLAELPKDLRNQLEAEHKRGLQSQIADLTLRAEQSDILRNQVDELMTTLPEGVAIGDVADSVKLTLDSMKSEREKLEAANKTAAEKLQMATDLATSNRQLFDNAKQDHEFAIHAGPKAVSAEAANLISMVLRPLSTTHDDGSVTVKMDVADENGHVEKGKDISVQEAVSLMEANVTAYGTLFTATQNGGGGSQVNGVRRTDSGEVDLAAMTKDPQKFFDLHKNDPGSLEKAANAAMQNGYR